MEVEKRVQTTKVSWILGRTQRSASNRYATGAIKSCINFAYQCEPEPLFALVLEVVFTDSFPFFARF